MQQQKVIFLNKVLFGVVIVLIIYLGISILLVFTPKEVYNVGVSQRNHGILSIKAESVASTPQQPLSYYKNVSSGRLFTPHIFTSAPILSPPKVEKLPVPEEKPIVPIPEITFQLIGIIWEEGRSNALIKSSQDQQTQLVTIGDKISGYQIVDITSHTVILSNEKERKVVRIKE